MALLGLLAQWFVCAVLGFPCLPSQAGSLEDVRTLMEVAPSVPMDDDASRTTSNDGRFAVWPTTNVGHRSACSQRHRTTHSLDPAGRPARRWPQKADGAACGSPPGAIRRRKAPIRTTPVGHLRIRHA